MRVECESCHELTAASFAIEDGAVVVTCTACHAQMKPQGGPPAPVDVARCPKCGAARTPDPACRTCGLAADRMASFAEARDAEIPAEVRSAWQGVLDGWDQPARHDELMKLVAQHSCYAWVAGRYHEAGRLRTSDTVAERQLDRLRRSAEASLLATATATEQPYRITIAVIGVLVLVAIAMAYVVFHENHEQSAPPTHQPARP